MSEDMSKFAMQVEYLGAGFSGWQRQDGQPTIQEALELAIQSLQEQPAAVTGAGRTDSGVHATGQVCHAELEKNWDPGKLRDAVNHHLKPNPIAVLKAARVDDSFHARFSAIERRYLYRIISRKAPLTLEKPVAWQIRHRLDAGRMREAARFLIGNHDFTTFRSSMCQAKSPVKTLDALDIAARPIPCGEEYRLEVRARSFLHNQVRSLAGTLERVGAGSWKPADVKAALEAKDRSACGPVAPPHGLCLEKVSYPEDPFGE